MSAKKIDFKKIALIGGGLWIGNKLLTKDPATVQAFSAASLGGGNVSDIEALKTLIKTDPQIRSLLKGDTGAAGADGGPQGPKGLDGLNSPNFAGSLVVNGALENNSLTNWVGGSISVGVDGMNSILLEQGVYTTNISKIRLNPNRLLRTQFYLKCDAGAVFALIRTFDKNLNQTLGGFVEGGGYSVYNYTSANATFQKLEGFCGGFENNNFAFPDGSVYGAFEIYADAGQYAEVSSLIVEYVDLGEPVPYTLPWLPAGQMIYDPATGDVGRWDGTVETWFATAP